jgi:hypothetical protein
MTRLRFGADEVRLGHALYRSKGHCLAACELHAGGRRSDALLQAARPMTDVLPWLETEARSVGAELVGFFKAVARMGSEVRRGARTGELRRSFALVQGSVDEVLDASLDPRASRSAYDVAVALELLEVAQASFADGVTEGNLDGYHSAYATAREALSLLTGAGVDGIERIAEPMSILRAAFPSIDPPELVVRPETLEDAVRAMTPILRTAFDLPSVGGGVDSALGRIERLLDDAVAAHENGVPALAARLAASLYIRSYQPIRDEVSARDAALEERLSELLGVEVRLAINRGAPAGELKGLRREAKRLLEAARAG